MAGATLETYEGALKRDYKAPKDLHMKIAQARQTRKMRPLRKKDLSPKATATVEKHNKRMKALMLRRAAKSSSWKKYYQSRGWL